MTTPDRSTDSGLVRRPIREAEVQQIAAMPEPIARNLWITTAYYDLAGGLTRAFGSRDVSWSAIAVWASKMAGAFIRGEELKVVLQGLLRESSLHSDILTPLRARLHALHPDADVELAMVSLFLGPVQRVADRTAQGNRTVFEELAPIFARMATFFAGPGAPTPVQIDQFVASVRSLDDAPTATQQLRSAFGHYCTAALESDVARRAQHVLVGTGLIGLTEQTRLQEFIAGALNAPLELPLIDGALDAVVSRWSRALPRDPILHRFTSQRDEIRNLLQSIWRRALTELVMTLRTPDRVFRLGEDVPPISDHQQFPDDLGFLIEPDLKTFADRYDRTGGTARGSGATDWADLEDRMNYLVNLFRGWQQHGRLLEAPFTDAQIAEMQAGRRPQGEL